MITNKNNPVYIVFDGQAGSCGKGKFIGYLTLRENIDFAINNNMSNAGHTFVFDDGTKVITSHLPISVVNPKTTLLIGPNAAITPEILEKEIVLYKELIGNRKIIIHPRAMIIQESHRLKEKEVIRSGSTFKGCAAAVSDKIMRVPGVELISNYYNKFSDIIKNQIELADTSEILINGLHSNKKIIIEGAQGFDLDINYGLGYPNTTSRQCTPTQMLADCGLPLTTTTKTYMIIRPYPIRISNETDLNKTIYSGDYNDSEELSWAEIKTRCGAPKDAVISEKTTVTKKERRVFEFNDERLMYADDITDPTYICLNFTQYLNYDSFEVQDFFELPSEVYEFIGKIEGLTRKFIMLMGTGPKNSDVVDLEIADSDKRW